MRNWNKLLALVLAMVMVFGLTATSFAAEADGDKKEDTTATDTTPAEGEDKTDDAAPAEGEDKADEAAPAEDADKTDDAAPAEGEDKTDDAAAPETEPAVEIDYTGVADYAKDAVAYVVGEKKLIANRATGLEPTAAMTRAEMVEALYNLAGAPAVEGENEFTDVADTASYKNAVIWAVANKITDGLGDGTFNPNGELTRQHIAVFLCRYVVNVAKGDVAVADDNLAAFPDAGDVASWGSDAMNWAVANKVVNGSKNANGVDELVPNGSAQRQQVAVILYRYITEVLPAAETTAPADDAADAETAAPAEDADKAADAADADAAADADKADDAAADADKADDADTEKTNDAADDKAAK